MASGSSLTADKVLQLTLAEDIEDELNDESDDEFLVESRSDFIDGNGAESLYPDDLLSSSSFSLLFYGGDIPQPAERDSVLRDEDEGGHFFFCYSCHCLLLLILPDNESDLPGNSSETDCELCNYAIESILSCVL